MAGEHACLEALCDDQSDLLALTLEKSVRGDGRRQADVFCVKARTAMGGRSAEMRCSPETSEEANRTYLVRVQRSSTRVLLAGCQLEHSPYALGRGIGIRGRVHRKQLDDHLPPSFRS